MDALQALAGLVVRRIAKVHDYFQLEFSNGTTLTVLNDHTYDGGSILNIEGRKIASIKESDSSVVICFDNGNSLSIGLTEEDFNGPEAMVMKQEGKSPIVWR